MPSNTPLTDAINALTQYANETTGASDTNLSDAVGTLIDGYGQGGGGWTTDGIASRAEPSGDITITLADGQTVGERAFQNCKNITGVTFTGSPYIGPNAFSGCTGLRTLHAEKLLGLRSSYYNSAQNVFYGCSSLEMAVFPSFGNYALDSYNFRNCTSLTAVDLNNASRIGGANVFDGCTNLTTFIIRKTDSAAGLQNVNNFSNTPFASGGTGGTLYVPSALISSYQSASNWSTILGYANNSIQAIEGSVYETKYADGTPIE